MNDNQIIPVGMPDNDPFQDALESAQLKVHSIINMGHLMMLHHPDLYRHVLVSIKEMATEELYHLVRKAA